ncbi:MAG TPA: LarC family nickel insertion protein, partial [Clostridia bacterium]
TELVTPTGMGLIKTLSNGFGKMPDILLEGAGYGHGKRYTGRFNSLRVMFGTGLDADRKDEIVLLETNIDDTTPELLGYTMERLLENGALDVFHTPVYMKKNRPAFILSVISRPEDEEKLVDIIFRETSSIGVRRDLKKRYVMQREFVTVNTDYGDSRVKISSYNGFKKAAPEYEDCRTIARNTGMPLESVYKIVMDKMERLF